MSETTGGNTVGTIHLALDIKDNLEFKVKQTSQKAADSAQKILDGINMGGFNASVERAKGKLQDLQHRYGELVKELDSMRFSGSNVESDKAFQKMSAQADKLIQQIAAQERELEIRQKEAAEKAIRNAQKQREKEIELARKSAAAQQAAAEKASQAQERASMRAAKAAEQAAAASRARMRKSLKESTQGIRRLGRTIRESFKAVFITAALYAAFHGLKDLFVNAAKQSEQFGAALSRLKSNLASAFQPIITAILPLLTALIDKLAQAAAAVSGFISRLFGTTFAKSKQAAASIKSTAAAAQKAAGQMASFDEHVVISKETGAGDTSGAGSTISQEDFDAAAAGEKFASNLLTTIAYVKQKASEAISSILAPFESFLKSFADGFANLWQGCRTLIETISKGLSEFWERNSVYITDIVDIALTSIQSITRPVGGFLAGVWNDLTDSFRRFAEDPAIANLLSAINEALFAAQPYWETFIDAVKKTHEQIETGLNVSLDGLRILIETAVEFIKNHFLLAIDSMSVLLEVLAKLLKGDLTGAWETLWEGSSRIMENMRDRWTDTWKSIVDTATDMIGRVSSVVSDTVDKIRDSLSSIGSGISNAVSNAKSWVSGKLESAGLIRHPDVPGFASGSVVRKPTLAMVGEYSGASSNPEIVAPQSMMAETFLGSIMPLVSMLEDKLDVIAQLLEILGRPDGAPSGSTGGDALAQLARILAPYMKSENDRTGSDLFDRR